MRNSITALRQGDKKSRVAAIHVLGRLETPPATSALVEALDSRDPDIRALAMGKLAFGKRGAIVPVLRKGLRDKEPRVRGHALFALQRQGGASEADAIARLMVADRDEIVRFNAALALAAVGKARHAPAFVRAVGDSNPNVMLTALSALVRLAPSRVSGLVVGLVRNAKRWGRIAQTQKDVILRLLKPSLEQKEVLTLLRRIVAGGLRAARRQGNSSYGMDVMEAACLLAEAGDPLGLPVLRVALKKGGEYGQQRGARAVGRLRETSAVPLLIEGPLGNGFFPTKLKAVAAMGEVGSTAALPTLASFFNDRIDDFSSDRTAPFTKDDPDLRLAALAAMAKIASATLREAARSGDAFEQKTARRLLAELKRSE